MFQILLMLQCLHKAMELDSSNAELHVAAVKYLHYCKFIFLRNGVSL